MRSHQVAGQDTIEFAVPHSLAFAFVPQWLAGLRTRFGAMRSRLIALNVHDAVLRLTEGGCDLLIAYHHPAQPLQLSPDRYEMLSLGSEGLAPYARADEGRPRYTLPGRIGEHVPFLAYSAAAYMARLVEMLLKQQAPEAMLDTVYETDMAEGLKAMALEGHGIAFLPFSAVRKDLRARRLAPAATEPGFELTMDVRIYRERPAAARHLKPGAQALWAHLQEHASAGSRRG
jgi:DNA-binding transcriptional LysR family regulator